MGPFRSALAEAGLRIEGCANRDCCADGEHGAILNHPDLLLGRAEGHAEQIRPRAGDVLTDLGALDGIVFKTGRRTVRSGDAEAGIGAQKLAGGYFRGSEKSAEEKDGEIVTHGLGAEALHEFPAVTRSGTG